MNTHNLAKTPKSPLSGLIFECFASSVTGSGRKYLQTSKFNPPHQGLSIEVHNVSVVQVEVEFLHFLLIVVFSGHHKKLRGSARFQFESKLYKIGIFWNY